MNYKTTLMLVLLLALVGGYFYFFEFDKISGYEAHQQKQSQRTEQLEGESLFEDMASSSINRIEIVHGDKTVSVVKEDDLWYQAKPVRFPLNDYAPQSVARQFAELRYLERVTPGGPDAPTAKQMGLDNPRAVITIKTDDREVSLLLGKVTLGGHAYVQVQGEDTAYVVNSTFLGAVLDEKITAWRKTTLDVPDASSASAAGLFGADGYDIFLVKIDGRWRFDSKSVQRASQSAIEDWFSDAGGVVINGFVEDNPDNPALYGLDVDYLRIQFFEPAENGAESKHTLHIGSADLEGVNRYAAWTTGNDPITVVFNISATSAEGLTRTYDDLIDPKVIAADTYDVRDLLVEQGGRTTLHLIRDPQSGYSFGEPEPGFDADYSTSHNMVKRLCELESTSHVNEMSSLGAPIAAVRVTLAGDDNTANFSIYKQGEDRVVVSEGELVGYIVPAADLDSLLGPSLGLRDRTVLEIEHGSIAGMTLRRDDGQVFSFVSESVVDQDRSWKLVDHDNFEAEAFDAMLGSLNPLRADRWLSEPVEPSAGWIEWALEPVGGAPVTLKASRDTGEALMSGIDSAFVLPQPLIRMLTAEYRERTVLSIDIDQIESVKLASELTSVTLARDGQRYTIDVGEVDQALAAAVFDTLSGLQVSRYVAPLHLRPEDIDFTIEFTTQDGETVTLRVVTGEGDTATVTIDGSRGEGHKGWFELSREVIDHLRAPLTEAESPIK